MNANQTAFLRLLNDAEAQTYALSMGQDAVIGREPDCQIVLDSARYGGVSRRHALIRYQTESLSFEISDLGSSNGTFVNGERLFNSQLLKSGDRIQLGSRGVLFSFDDPALPLTVVRTEASSEASLGASLEASSKPNQPSHPAPSHNPSPSASVSIDPGGKNNIGKVAAIAGGALLVILLAVFRGGFREGFSARSPATSPSSSAPTVSEQPSDTPDSSSSSSSPSPSGTSESADSAAANVQSLSDPNGLFQVDLPAGYQTESRADGINLSSTDGSFQGAITAVRIPQPLATEQLIQGFTDQQNGNSNLQNFMIQNTETINEGVRIDWVARLSSADSDLDAVTHFLQQGKVVVEVDLFSVGRPFSQQDANEANVILRSLRITP